MRQSNTSRRCQWECAEILTEDPWNEELSRCRAQLQLLREIAVNPAVWDRPHYVTAIGTRYQRSTVYRLVERGWAELVEPITITGVCAIRGPRELRITEAGREHLRSLGAVDPQVEWGPW